MKTSSKLSSLTRKSIVAILALLSVTIFSERAAATIIGLCNTGWTASCGGIQGSTGGAADPNYLITVNPNGGPGQAIIVNTFTFPVTGPWLADSAVSHWIGPAADQDVGNCCAVGTYFYRDFFTSTGGPETIAGRWAADNSVSVYLDGIGNALALGANFTTWANFSFTTAPLIAGNHFLEFRVNNNNNPTGLRVEYAAPEPATLALLGLGLAGLGFSRRKQ